MKKQVLSLALIGLLFLPSSYALSSSLDKLPEGFVKAKQQLNMLLSYQEQIYYITTLTEPTTEGLGFLFQQVDNSPVLDREFYHLLALNAYLAYHGKTLQEQATFPISRDSFLNPTKKPAYEAKHKPTKEEILKLEQLLRRFCLGGENLLLYTLLGSNKLNDPPDPSLYFGTMKWSLRRSAWQLYGKAQEKLIKGLSQMSLSAKVLPCLTSSEIQTFIQHYQESLFFGSLYLTLADPSITDSFWKKLEHQLLPDLTKNSLSFSSQLSEHLFETIMSEGPFDDFPDLEYPFALTTQTVQQFQEAMNQSTNPVLEDSIAKKILDAFLPPSLPMFRSSPARTGRQDIVGPKTSSLLWKKSLGDWVVSSPVVLADQSILVGCFDGNLYHLSESGEILWKFYAGSWIVCTPAVSGDGTIYFGNQNGFLFALSSTGQLKWKVSLGSMVGSSPVLTRNEEIVIGSFDGSLYCVSKEGTVRWSYKTGSWILSSPAVMDKGNIVFGSTDYHIYCLSPQGSLIWKYKTQNMVVASPAISKDGRIYIGSLDQTYYCLTSGGTLVWMYPASSWVISSGAIGGTGNLYFAEKNGTIHALDREGKELWTYQTSGVLEGSPLLDKNDVLYITSWDRKLYAIKEGTLLWSFRFESESRSTPCLSKNGTLYVGAEDKMIYAFQNKVKED